MTLGISRDGQKVTIHGNIGLDVSVIGGQVASFAVKEDATHLRYFAGQLIKCLDDADAERTDNA